jgi:hypothetical protein
MGRRVNSRISLMFQKSLMYSVNEVFLTALISLMINFIEIMPQPPVKKRFAIAYDCS